MLVTEIGDPRLKALFGAGDPRSSTVRPVVRLRRGALPPLAFGISAAVAAVLLFCALNERRTGERQPAVRVAEGQSAGASWQAPPPLYIPPAEDGSIETPALSLPNATVAEPAHRFVPTPLPPFHGPAHSLGRARTGFEAPPAPAILANPVARGSSGAPLLIDQAGGGAQAPALPPVLGVTASPAARDLPDTGRVHSTSLANPSLTVPQGSLIPAVLETGFDSTRPSFARAMVSRDVRGFDGKDILIPRGSRLIGESRSPAVQDQKRAIIIWTRLILPDGTAIDIDSPGADTVGRGGIQASVDTHFLSRVGDAIGRTILDLGKAFIGRSGPLVLLSGSEASGQSRVIGRPGRAPILKIAPGTSISVFVAHDLEFSSAGGRQ